MGRSVVEYRVWLVVATLAVAAPTGASGQVLFVDGFVSQSYTSASPLPSPLGFSAVAGVADLFGPVGFEVSYRRVREDGEEVAQHCTFASCTPGPFVPSHSLRTVGVGLSYDFRNQTGVMLTLGLHGTANEQVERLTRLDTEERLEGYRIGSDLGLGASATLRLRPAVLGVRPTFAARYDRVSGSECVPDATCFGPRRVLAVSIGLSLVRRLAG